MRHPVYLDNQATTLTDPEVVRAVKHAMSITYGNASSTSHTFGEAASKLVEDSREKVATLIGSDPREIIFTSGATESNNLAILGVMKRHDPHSAHMIVSQIEHPSVLECARHLESEGYRVTYLPVTSDGIVSPEELARALQPDTVLVSVMYANNEIGTLNPVSEIGRICHERGIIFHCDAVQALAYERIAIKTLDIDLLSMSGHKIHGPKGIGSLYVAKRKPKIELLPIMHGGDQEFGLRAGSLNVPGIAGFATACEIVGRDMDNYSPFIRSLRNTFLEIITTCVSDFHINGSMDHRLPNNLNLSFTGVDSEALKLSAKSVAFSSGSACTTKEVKPSHVLLALGYDQDRVSTSARFGFSKFNTGSEIEDAANSICRSVKQLRSFAINS